MLAGVAGGDTMKENLDDFHMGPGPTKPFDKALFLKRMGVDMSSPVLRCKMRVNQVLHQMNPDGTVQQERVELIAVYGPEGSDNAQWSKWTPSANFTININNPEAFNKLSQGHEFFVDFTPAG